MAYSLPSGVNPPVPLKYGSSRNGSGADGSSCPPDGTNGRITGLSPDAAICCCSGPRVPASTTRNGSCTAPAATLYEIVRKLPDGAEVELDRDIRLTAPDGGLRACDFFMDEPSVMGTENALMAAASMPHRNGAT